MENIPVNQSSALPHPTNLAKNTNTQLSSHKPRSNRKTETKKKAAALQPSNFSTLDLSSTHHLHPLGDKASFESEVIDHPPSHVQPRAISGGPNSQPTAMNSRKKQLPTPPNSRQPDSAEASGSAPSPSTSFDVFSPAPGETIREVSPGQTSASGSRKRGRLPPVSAGIFGHDLVAASSPNPKARKQAKTGSSTLAINNNHQATEPLARRSVSIIPERPSNATTATSGTPPRKSNTRQAPKTEKPAAKKKGKATGQKTRRKSAPLKQLKTPPQFDLTLPPSPESPSDDPLLLVGTEEWVRIPWKPMFIKNEDGLLPKTEEEEPLGQEKSVMSVVDDEHEMDDQNILAPLESATQAEEVQVETQHQDTWQDMQDPESDSDHGDYDPLADSSFVGRDLDIGDEDTRDFTIPLRLNSPPSRRRRSSAVSQRPPTPKRLSSDGSISRTPVRLPPPGSPSPSPRRLLFSPQPQVPRSPFAYNALAASSTSPSSRLASPPELREGEGYDHDPSGFIAAVEVEEPTQEDEDEDLTEEMDLSGDVREQSSQELSQEPTKELSPDVHEQPFSHLLSPWEVSVEVPENSIETTANEELVEEDHLMEVEMELSTKEEEQEENLFEVGEEDEEYPILEEESIVEYLEPIKDEDASSDLINLDEEPYPPPDDDLIVVEEDVQDANECAIDDEDEDSSLDDDQDPVIEISSRDPMMAARAAAILKMHHDYIEDGLRSKYARRRTSLASSVNDSMVLENGRFDTPVQDSVRRRPRRSSITTPVHPLFLRKAEQEVTGTPSSTGPISALQLGGQRYATPPARRIPMIVIDPASSRPEDYAQIRGVVWTKDDWRTLEKCLLGERRAIAVERGVETQQVAIDEVDVSTVIEKFREEQELYEDELVGEWSWEKLERRCVALKIRHGGQVAAPSLRGMSPSPMIVPLTPLIHRGGMSLARSETPDSLLLTRQSSAISTSSSTLPPSLLAPRYAHLHDEHEVSQLRKPPSIENEDQDSAAPVSQRSISQPPLQDHPTKARPKRPASKIPVSVRSTTLPPTSSAPLSTAKPPAKVVDTPTTTSRVLKFLGLGSILRTSGPPKIVIPKNKKQELPSSQEPEEPRRIKARVPDPRPISPEEITMHPNISKEDLNHVELPTPQPIPKPIPPKELVELNPVPLPPSPPLHRPSSRRGSGSSVRDLKKFFEELEDEKDSERSRIKDMIFSGRKAVMKAIPGDRSLRRVPSNLSTASVITAED